MIGAAQIFVICSSALSAVLSAGTIVTLRKGRRYNEQNVQLWDEATRKWEALAEQLARRVER